ncbi:VOC family protein [Streptomyces sp. NPDC058486]|uniref:VOC family protein n=1 Tax=unclassified Streptomyces TaxID=2593676 RepID=UPI00364F7A56
MSAIGTLNTAHIGINVTDLDRSLRFYGEVLGFDVIGSADADGRRYAFLGQGGTLAVTLWQQAEGGYDATRAGLHHLAFEAESIEKVREAETALKAAGVTFAYDGVVAHGEGTPSGGIFFHDPDGTRLEITTPKGAEEAPTPNGNAPTCGFF